MHDTPGSCHDCGAKEGELHAAGCDHERCPFCGGQLMDVCWLCAHELLGLTSPRALATELTAAQRRRWAALMEPRRIAFGGLSPEYSRAWSGQGASPREELLDLLARSRHPPKPIVRGSPVAVVASLLLPGFGTLRVRRYQGYTGFNPATGKPTQVPDQLSLLFECAKPLAQVIKGAPPSKLPRLGRPLRPGGALSDELLAIRQSLIHWRSAALSEVGAFSLARKGGLTRRYQATQGPRPRVVVGFEPPWYVAQLEPFDSFLDALARKLR